MHTLAVEKLSKRYSGKLVVDGVNLGIGSGEIVGLLGPNGAGKTTTFYMIVGMLKPDEGSITLDGEGIGHLPMYKRAEMGISYLPQEPSIFRKLTVRDNLRAVLEIKGLSEDEIKIRIEHLLDEFNLREFAERDSFRLSGGERRRAEIARSIAIEPKFILFDEPFAGIDPIAIIELKKMLKYLKDRGLGVLITDHNVRETLSITDRAYILSHGEILEEGLPEKIVSSHRVKDIYLGEEFKL
ncbi:MAG: LPS export ABC transporter ATP-binding protein [Nitrospirae bacterium]|nr:LPS export ABC transporter ATP-binding protein [Nitrospirota bacterium]